MEDKWMVQSLNDSVEINVESIKLTDLPSLIQDQFLSLNDLDRRVKSAIKKAAEAQQSADYAKEKSAGLFHKKEAIEALQSAGYDLADAVISQAEAQKISFEFQSQLAKITQYLFGLGVSNIALNRAVVREITLKLAGASQEELSDLARQEALNVIKQLKSQEDIMIKQENLSKKVKQNEELLQTQLEKDRQYDEQLQIQAEKNKEHDGQLQTQAEKDKEYDEQLQMQARKDKEHDEQLQIREEKDKKHDEQLQIQAEKDKEHDEQLQIQAEKGKEHDEQLRIQKEKNSEYDLSLCSLHEENNLLLRKVDADLQIIQEQEEKIVKLNDRIINLEFEIKLKANKTIIPKLSFVIASIALISAIVRFFV